MAASIGAVGVVSVVIGSGIFGSELVAMALAITATEGGVDSADCSGARGSLLVLAAGVLRDGGMGVKPGILASSNGDPPDSPDFAGAIAIGVEVFTV